MNADDLIALLRPHFAPDAEIQAVNQGNKFEVLIVDDVFDETFGTASAVGVCHCQSPYPKRSNARPNHSRPNPPRIPTASSQ